METTVIKTTFLPSHIRPRKTNYVALSILLLDK